MGGGVKALHINVHRGEGVFLAVALVFRHIHAARHADELGEVIAALAHVHRSGVGDVEKRHRFSGVRLVQHRLHRRHFLVKNAGGLFFLAQQRSIQLDPLHAAQRVRFIAGVIHQHRNAQALQLLLNLRIVVDHGGFHCKAALLGQNQLVIRGVVFARVENVPCLHGLLRLRQIPAALFGAGQPDDIQPVQRPEQIHGCSGGQINVLDGLLQNRDFFGHPGRDLCPLLHQKVLPVLRNGDSAQPVSAVLNFKLFGIFKFRCTLRSQFRPAFFPAVPGAARQKAEQKHRTQGQRPMALHGGSHGSTFCRAEESKVRVYSISWGVLMATVSARTFMGASKPFTGMMKVELPSAFASSNFSSSTFM